MVDDARSILNWLISPTSVTMYNTGDTMRAFIPKKIVTDDYKLNSRTGKKTLVVKSNSMLFPSQTTSANNLDELQQYIEDLILSAVGEEYDKLPTDKVLELKWQHSASEGTQYEKYYNLVAGSTERTVARIIIVQPETSFTNLKKGLDAWFKAVEIDSQSTE
tara:strand:+ start:1940 stop:2425 length:486 start_codon:yes stop_codon:yes gene_type:complete